MDPLPMTISVSALRTGALFPGGLCPNASERRQRLNSAKSAAHLIRPCNCYSCRDSAQPKLPAQSPSRFSQWISMRGILKPLNSTQGITPLPPYYDKWYRGSRFIRVAVLCRAGKCDRENMDSTLGPIGWRLEATGSAPSARRYAHLQPRGWVFFSRRKFLASNGARTPRLRPAFLAKYKLENQTYNEILPAPRRRSIGAALFIRLARARRKLPLGQHLEPDLR